MRIFEHAVEARPWLASQYFGSPEFLTLDTTSQRTRRGVIESCLREPLKPGSKLTMGQCPFKLINATHILVLRNRRADKPGAANNRRKYLSAMFGWAVEQPKFNLGANPCRDVRSMRYASQGYYTWTIDNVRQYVERHPIGTMAYLALALMLFLGARRGDAVKLGPKNIRDGVMVYVPRKTAYSRVEESIKPILPPLADAIRLTPTGLKTFLVTGYGLPFTDGGFGNWMRDRCDEAGLPECTSHGLKKIAATICAELGATDRQMMAVRLDHREEGQEIHRRGAKPAARRRGIQAARNPVMGTNREQKRDGLRWPPQLPYGPRGQNSVDFSREKGGWWER